MFKVVGVGWGRSDPDFRRVFTNELIPDGTEAQRRWFDELQRISATPEMAERIVRARAEIDVTALASEIRVPTLVLHAAADVAVPFDEGRQVAAAIPGARFVPLEGRNHILLAHEPAWPRFRDEIVAFVSSTPEPVDVSAAAQPLSERELEVVRLVARGRSNEEIASEMNLSVRTVERHLGNVYLKLGLTGKSARAAAAARFAELVRRHGANA
jgi:DNA-binding NarL/FixJ family response regulator